MGTKKGKSKKKAKKKYSGPTLIDRLPSNRGEWLQLCIEFTKKRISDPPRESEKFMIEQVRRLEGQLREWNTCGVV